MKTKGPAPLETYSTRRYWPRSLEVSRGRARLKWGLLGAGVGLQEILHGLDVNIGGRTAFTTPGGTLVGISVSWLFL